MTRILSSILLLIVIKEGKSANTQPKDYLLIRTRPADNDSDLVSGIAAFVKMLDDWILWLNAKNFRVQIFSTSLILRMCLQLLDINACKMFHFW